MLVPMAKRAEEVMTAYLKFEKAYKDFFTDYPNNPLNPTTETFVSYLKTDLKDLLEHLEKV